MKDSFKQFYNENSPARLEIMPDASKQKVKFNILSKIANMDKSTTTEEPKRFTLINLKTLFTRSYVVIPLALLLLISGSTIVSANSLPGDTFYPLKRGVETVSVLIAPTEQEKTELKVKFAQKRIEELETLKQRGDITDDSANDSVKVEASQQNHIEKEVQQNKNNFSANSKVRVSKKTSRLSPAIKKRIEDDVREAREILDHNRRGTENRIEGDLENKFHIEREDIQLQTNTDFQFRNRSK